MVVQGVVICNLTHLYTTIKCYLSHNISLSKRTLRNVYIYHAHSGANFHNKLKTKDAQNGLLGTLPVTKKLQQIINTYYSGFIVDITYSPHT
jgi:hypothetical protein